MSKASLGVVLAAALLGVLAVVYFVSGGAPAPEPTAEERLSEAAENAAEAVGDAVTALGEIADETRAAVSEEVTAAAEEIADSATAAAGALADRVNAATEETVNGLNDLITAWNDSGIVTEGGIDFDQAIAAVDASDLSDEAKAQATDILQSLRDAPSEAAAKLSDLEDALRQARQ